jgi:hypothetical protein
LKSWMVTMGRRAFRAIPALFTIMSIWNLPKEEAEVEEKRDLTVAMRDAGPVGKERSACTGSARMLCSAWSDEANSAVEEAEEGEV